MTMAHTFTAEQLLDEVRHMPGAECAKFFAMLGQHLFADADASHQEVFGHLDATDFTATQAAQYLEVSLPTLRRYVQSSNLKPSTVVGRNQMFAARDLQVFKRSLRDAKRV
jgi:hypothetical protein